MPVLPGCLLKHLPATMDGAADLAFRLVPEALDQIFGPGTWETFKAGSEGRTTYVRLKREPAG